MYPCFDVKGISVGQLLHEWKWMVQGEFDLSAVNPFGDLFLEDVNGTVHRLDITGVTISAIARSEMEFREAAKDRRDEWFLEGLAERAGQKGCGPKKGQCVGYKIPPVFKESANVPDNAYVADLYEFVSFMGDLHHQISDVPDGGQVRLRVQPRPEHP